MTNGLESTGISCPYCGEYFTTFVDTSINEQHYIEDCQICCAPIVFIIHIDAAGDITVTVKRDDE